jgi:streptogramin lyase
MKNRPLLLALALAPFVPARTTSAQTISEFRIPATGSQPLEIAAGPRSMWFTNSGTNQIGSISFEGNISLFPVSQSPRGIAAGADGTVWFTSDRFVSRMDPKGVVTDFPAAGTIPGNPNSIVVGPDGSFWFTDADTEGGRVGKATAAGSVTEQYIPSTLAIDPAGITFAPDGSMWVTVFGKYADSTVNRIAFPDTEITPGRNLTEYVLPGHRGLSAITFGSDGNLWFTETMVDKIGRITPTGEITEYSVAGGPRGITVGPEGEIWFTESTGNKIARITDGVVTEFPLPTPGARPWGISAGPDGNIWFTEPGAGRIGRLNLTGLPGDAPSICLGGERFCVSLVWHTATGESGVGHPVSLSRNSAYFWFFDPDDAEVVVKVVDGCAVNGHEWVFAGGLTNVDVVLTVTDKPNGLARSYFSRQGTPFAPIQDTGTFSSCPQASGPRTSQ